MRYSCIVVALLCCFISPRIVFAQGEGGFESVMTIGAQGMGDGQFGYVEDFARSDNGKLLATDASHAFVQVFNPTTGKFIAKFGGKGDMDENLEKPEGIAVAPNGDIYVADYTTGFVKIYGKDYAWKKTFSEYGEEPGQNIKSEFMSVYDNKLYMAEAGNHRVNVFDLDGNFLFLFGDNNPVKLNNPEAAKASSAGLIYVADLKNDRMVVFDKDGKFIKSWGETGNGEGQFKTPAGVALDKYDNVYVTEI